MPVPVRESPVDASSDRGSGRPDQEFADQGFTDQSFTDQDFADQGFTDQDFTAPWVRPEITHFCVRM
ncbi:hypothetical protein GCM10009591_04110 [Brachybacterium tyrofermentans]